MAHASNKHVGPGAHEKGSGSGARASVPKDKIGENMVLSNRDKSRHSKERGLDSREIQNKQLQDNARNRLEHLLFDGAPVPDKGVIRADLSRPGLGLEFKRQDARKYAL